MDKHKDEAFSYSSLKGLVEKNAAVAGETAETTGAPPVVAAAMTPRKKPNRAGERNGAGEIPLLKTRIEFLEAMIANLESENANLRRHLEAERKELRKLTTALLEINQGAMGKSHALERKLLPASLVNGSRPLTSRAVILIIGVLAFIIVQVVLLIYADGYFFAS